jgi:ABC-type enterochelin transport system permease subunit
MESHGVHKKSVSFLGIVLISLAIVIIVTHTMPFLPLIVVGVGLYLLLRRDDSVQPVAATGPEADKAR